MTIDEKRLAEIERSLRVGDVLGRRAARELIAALREAWAETVRARADALREGFEIAIVCVDVTTSDEAGYVNPGADFRRARAVLEKRIEGSGR